MAACSQAIVQYSYTARNVSVNTKVYRRTEQYSSTVNNLPVIINVKTNKLEEISQILICIQFDVEILSVTAY
jgi:hypothetical protein